VDLQEAMSLAQEIEERNDLMEQYWKNRLGLVSKSEGMGLGVKSKANPTLWGEISLSPAYMNQSASLRPSPMVTPIWRKTPFWYKIALQWDTKSHTILVWRNSTTPNLVWHYSSTSIWCENFFLSV